MQFRGLAPGYLWSVYRHASLRQPKGSDGEPMEHSERYMVVRCTGTFPLYRPSSNLRTDSNNLKIFHPGQVSGDDHDFKIGVLTEQLRYFSPSTAHTHGGTWRSPDQSS